MNYRSIALQISDDKAKITLNRPHALNAIDSNMRSELLQALITIASNKSVKVLVITGAGKAFCDGGNISGMEPGYEESTEERDIRARVGNEIVSRIVELPFPVIASINGDAKGSGCALAMACDLRIAAENAKFNLASARAGTHGDVGATYFLPRLVGPSKAMELLLTADTIDANEACRIGLINRTVPSEELESATNQFVDWVSRANEVGAKLTKLAMYENSNVDLATALKNETKYELECSQQDRFLEQDDRGGESGPGM